MLTRKPSSFSHSNAFQSMPSASGLPAQLVSSFEERGTLGFGSVAAVSWIVLLIYLVIALRDAPALGGEGRWFTKICYNGTDLGYGNYLLQLQRPSIRLRMWVTTWSPSWGLSRGSWVWGCSTLCIPGAWLCSEGRGERVVVAWSSLVSWLSSPSSSASSTVATLPVLICSRGGTCRAIMGTLSTSSSDSVCQPPRLLVCSWSSSTGLGPSVESGQSPFWSMISPLSSESSAVWLCISVSEVTGSTGPW